MLSTPRWFARAAAATLVLTIVMGSGCVDQAWHRIRGESHSTLSVHPYAGDQASDVNLTDDELMEEAPSLLTALRDAHEEGRGGVYERREVEATIAYLQSRTEPNAARWVVGFEGELFSIGQEVS